MVAENGIDHAIEQLMILALEHCLQWYIYRLYVDEFIVLFVHCDYL